MKKHQMSNLTGQLPVSLFKQDGCVIAYSPALDLSTYGTTEKEAEKNFGEMVALSMESFSDARELGQVLLSLGWTKQPDAAWQPPKVTQKNLDLKTVFA